MTSTPSTPRSTWPDAALQASLADFLQRHPDELAPGPVQPTPPGWFDAGRATELAAVHRQVLAYEPAVVDLTEVLRLCDVWNRDYYRTTARFVRGYAQLRLGRPTETIKDCSGVKDDFRWWVEHGLRTKAAVLAEAEAMIIDLNGPWRPKTNDRQ